MLYIKPWKRKKPTDPFVQLQEQMDKQQHVIDSLTTVGHQLKSTEKQIEIKWRTRNEKQIIYILTSADTVQPAIRTKQRARADSLIAHYE